jgi:predicted dehydrogenase
MARVGLVGANAQSGSWGARTHVPAVKALPDYELKAIGTAHKETAEAAAKAFGAEMGFHDLDAMFGRPDIDLVTVAVRVPYHHEITMKALSAGKHVFCEWPLGADTREAEEMTEGAHKAGVHTMVGLQGRGDPALNHVRNLINGGYVGDVLAANLTVMHGGILARPFDRTWQGDPAKGGNTLTIAFGHAIDAFCYCLGDFAEVSARLSTQVKQWRATDTGAMVDVTSPDNVLVSGELKSGAVASVHVGALPYNGSGCKIEIYGSEGTMVITADVNTNLGLSSVRGAKKDEKLAELPVPSELTIVPEGTPKGTPFNMAQMYTRFADAYHDDRDVTEANFDHALRLHRLLDSIRQASSEGRAVKVG